MSIAMRLVRLNIRVSSLSVTRGSKETPFCLDPDTEMQRDPIHCYFLRTILKTSPLSNSRTSEFSVRSWMMLVRVSSRNVLGFFVVVESFLPSTATRALIKGPWTLRISKVPFGKKLKVPPFMGPSLTSQVPTNSGGTLFQTKTFSTANVPPPVTTRQRAPKPQSHSLNFLPFS